MKLVHYIESGTRLWGELDLAAETVRPFAEPFETWAPAVTAAGRDGVSFAGPAVPLASVKLLAPLHETAEILGTGVNYATHGLPRHGADVPFYMRPHSAIANPEETIFFPDIIKIQPKGRFSYEIELCVIMGREVTDPDHGIRDVLGYTVGNDGRLVFQRPNFIGMDMTGSKCGHRGSSIGPWIVTKDEISGDTQPDIEMTMRINGVVTQNARTSAMNKDVSALIYELDDRIGLKAGDVIYTGTPGYIGMDTGYYTPGDLIEAEIEGIGTLRNYMEQTNRDVAGEVVRSAHEVGWR
jgi:2-keto-4-pentenoate hydratase/2-oxohepta-3-ene-1,7-dioic acid hydratase in catechol pathway